MKGDLLSHGCLFYEKISVVGAGSLSGGLCRTSGGDGGRLFPVPGLEQERRRDLLSPL